MGEYDELEAQIPRRLQDRATFEVAIGQMYAALDYLWPRGQIHKPVRILFVETILNLVPSGGGVDSEAPVFAQLRNATEEFDSNASLVLLMSAALKANEVIQRRGYRPAFVHNRVVFGSKCW